ncbi:MAG: enoyl-CoA hydratase/isomerase family protein [Chloroflexota bacterium]|nr:MAG: enoyl-CoA hydratase/isomerase family protein [Chloroflexota bacterium]
MAVVEVQKEGKIIIVTINRPEARNALNSEVRQGLNQAYADFRDDPNLWVAILTGAGDKAFSAGADIKEFRPGPSAATVGEVLHPDHIWKPFIAAINGYALGGGLELAMQCDIRLAADHARLGQPEINIGFMPGAGGTQRLPRFVPRAMAAQILLLGEPINAQEAYRIGLVNKVVPLDQLLPTAKQWAETICQKGPVGVRASKEAMIRGYDLPLNEGLKLERELAQTVRMSEDFAEGTRAFVEKRPPQYKGK